MAKALIHDNKVVDIQETEFDVHSSMTWVDNCPSDCQIGWDYDGTNFTDPDADNRTATEIAADNLKDLRESRNRLLAETDYVALSDVPMSTDMVTYRQALRDITNTYQSIQDDGFTWPTKP